MKPGMQESRKKKLFESFLGSIIPGLLIIV
jgi:hypothetical protein